MLESSPCVELITYSYQIQCSLFSVVCTTWLVPGNPFVPLGLNSNYDIHSTTQTN